MPPLATREASPSLPVTDHAADAQAADAKKRKRDVTPEHLRAQRSAEEKLLRSDEPRSRHQDTASSAWTLQLPRPLASLLRDLCERLPVEHFITVRSVAHAASVDLSGQWTVETSHESSHVLPRWMQDPELLRPEHDGELTVTMHTHHRAAITQSLDTVTTSGLRPLAGLQPRVTRLQPRAAPRSPISHGSRCPASGGDTSWRARARCSTYRRSPTSTTCWPTACTCTSSPRPSTGSSATYHARARPPS